MTSIMTRTYEYQGSPPVYGEVRVVHLFSFLYCVVCLCPVSCVPNVASVSGLSILDCLSAFLKRSFTF